MALIHLVLVPVQSTPFFDGGGSAMPVVPCVLRFSIGSLVRLQHPPSIAYFSYLFRKPALFFI